MCPLNIPLPFICPWRHWKKLHKYVPEVHTLILDGVCWSPMQDLPQFPMSWLSSVENLKVTSGALLLDEPIFPRVLLNGFTHLRKLELRDFGYSREVQLPWEQITSLKLHYWPVDRCISLLVQCPELVEFHALDCHWPESEKPHIPRLSDHAHKLEHLSWGFWTSPTVKFLSHQLWFPSLRTFYRHSPGIWRGLVEDEMGALRSLVSNFPLNFSQLHLFGSQAWSDEFTEFVFVELKGLKFVHLFECESPIVVQLLSLLNRVDDWGLLHFAVTCRDCHWNPTFGKHEEWHNTIGRQNYLSYNSIISPLWPS